MDFFDAIERGVGSCGVLAGDLATMARPHGCPGQSRLDDPSDYVRLEIAVAPERDIQVVAVLLQGRSCRSS